MAHFDLDAFGCFCSSSSLFLFITCSNLGYFLTFWFLCFLCLLCCLLVCFLLPLLCLFLCPDLTLLRLF